MSESARAATSRPATKRDFFEHIVLFIRQVTDELCKVVLLTMNELWTYFTVVVIFIITIMAFTGVLGFAFNRAVVWLFA